MARILVIDDSEVMRRYLRLALGEAHEIDEWLPPSAMEIVEHVQETRPDLVLTDYQMPGCNGATVARMVQKAIPGLPVLVLTAIRDEEVAETLRKFQVREILYKPASREAILATVNRLLIPPG